MGAVAVWQAGRMAAALFRETSAQRFCRESREMWEKVQTGDCLENVTRASQPEGTSKKTAEEKKPIDKEDPQPVKIVQSNLPPMPSNEGNIFPRKKKGGLVNIKPAVWEKNNEKMKNTVLKKEKRKTKLG